MTKPRTRRSILAQVLGRMATTETLINDLHAETTMMTLLSEADRVEDPQEATSQARGELCALWGIEDGPEGPKKPFIYNDGVAIIPVHGVLINRFNYSWGWLTGYDFIRRQKNAALADEDVDLIVYDHDTVGGEAAGCSELAREIYESREIKPSLALVNSLSLSAGCWLSTPCTRVVCAPSASFASIGVYQQFTFIGKMMAELGIEVDFVKAGKFKTSGNQFEKMSREEREYFQRLVDQRADEFYAAVAEFRGIEESVVKGTDARVMRPPEALSLGLIDAALAPAEAVSDYLAEIGREGPSGFNQEDAMAERTNQQGQQPGNQQQAQITDEQRNEIASQARADAQARIKGIVTHAEAKGREDMANHLAYDTDMTADAAVALLAKAPKAAEQPGNQQEQGQQPGNQQEQGQQPGNQQEQGQQPGNQQERTSAFQQQMDNGEHPDVGPNAEQGGGGGEETGDKVARILGAHTAATGRRYDERQKASA